MSFSSRTTFPRFARRCAASHCVASVRASICPYRGLEPFREEDAAFFGGRDNSIGELVARVKEYSFVAVVGPSGSGKSSLVFAGLLPALRQSRTIDMGCGHSTARQVAVACTRRSLRNPSRKRRPAAIDTYLKARPKPSERAARTSSSALVDVRLDATPEKPDRLLIYIDQWEELYAMMPAAEDKERFSNIPPTSRNSLRWRSRRRPASVAGKRRADGARGLLQSAHPQSAARRVAAAPAGQYPADAREDLGRHRNAGHVGGAFVCAATIGRSNS